MKLSSLAVRRSALSVLSLGALLACQGCASMFIHGGRIVGGDTSLSGQTATYAIAGCVDPSGAPITAPVATYHVLPGQNGPELLERSPDGSGVAISNRWQDTDGTHFFAWGAGAGWEYVVPTAGPAVRRAYVRPAGRDEPDGTRRPVVSGPPASTCQLNPS